MSDVPAGWQPDPERPGGLRYWDGTQWTEHRQAPAAAPAAPTPPPTAAPSYPPPTAPSYPPPAAPYGAPGYAAGTPFVPGAPGAPVQNNNSGCLKWGLIALGVLVVFGIAGAGCLVLVVNNAADTISRSFGEADRSDYSIVIDGCTAESSGTVQASGTIKNKANRRQAYSVEVSVTTDDDTVIGSSLDYVSKLDENQSGTWSVTVFGSVPEGSRPRCKITSVSYRP